MTVHDGSLSTLILRPLNALRETEFIPLSGGFAVETERPDTAGRPHLKFLANPSVGDDKPSPIQYVMADETVQKNFHVFAKLRRFALELRDCHVEAMCGRYLGAFELFQQLDVMVSRNADRGRGLGHVHDQPQYFRVFRASVAEVAQKNRLPGTLSFPGSRMVSNVYGITQFSQKFTQLVKTTVNVADDVEGAFLAALVGP